MSSVLFLLIIICLLMNCTCADTILNENKITKTNFAYQVLLLYKGVPFCGGTIIDNKHVLTAASCCKPKSKQVVKPSELSILFGNVQLFDTTNLKKVDSIFIHENFTFPTYTHNIAVVRIVDNFENSDDIQYIKLRTNHLWGTHKCNTSGWSTNYYNLKNDPTTEFKFSEVFFIDKLECNETFFERGFFRKDIEICAESTKRDSCIGDTGGPLVCYGELTGILSDGVGCDHSFYKQLPSLYSEIANYIEWIEIQRNKPSSSTKVGLSVICFLMMTLLYF